MINPVAFPVLQEMLNQPSLPVASPPAATSASVACTAGQKNAKLNPMTAKHCVNPDQGIGQGECCHGHNRHAQRKPGQAKAVLPFSAPPSPDRGQAVGQRSGHRQKSQKQRAGSQGQCLVRNPGHGEVQGPCQPKTRPKTAATSRERSRVIAVLSTPRHSYGNAVMNPSDLPGVPRNKPPPAVHTHRPSRC